MSYKAGKDARNSGRVKSYEDMMNRRIDQIDHRARKGKVEEDGEYAAKHYNGADKDGNRKWSF